MQGRKRRKQAFTERPYEYIRFKVLIVNWYTFPKSIIGR